MKIEYVIRRPVVNTHLVRQRDRRLWRDLAVVLGVVAVVGLVLLGYTWARLEVLRNGYAIGDIVTRKADRSGIAFKVEVKNITDGHNVPTGFTGERLVWLRVTVTDAEGKVVLISGDTDPNGDVRDNESSYVHAGEMDLDRQLFSLQSRFLVQNIRGFTILLQLKQDYAEQFARTRMVLVRRQEELQFQQGIFQIST